ncbi:phosphotransferase family protein [Verrucomicrobiota bacterium sgz303538]
MSRRRAGVDWSHLRWIIESSLQRIPDFADEFRVQGRISYRGEGIGHDNYVFQVGEELLVLRMGKRYRSIRTETEARESLLREAETLQQVVESNFPFSTPKFVCMAQDQDREPVGLIETFVEGTPLSLFDNPIRQETRFGSIAEIAAAVHRLPKNAFGHLKAATDRRSHVLGLLDALPETIFTEYPIAAAVRDWIQDHLPEGPSVVLHGDLLPQNLLLDFTDTGEVAVIDWESAQIGDPAYDLAIVTRGSRKPLKQSGGFQLLLDAYNSAAGELVSAAAVRVHELLLHLNWLAETDQAQKAGVREGQGPDFLLRSS